MPACCSSMLSGKYLLIVYIEKVPLLIMFIYIAIGKPSSFITISNRKTELHVVIISNRKA